MFNLRKDFEQKEQSKPNTNITPSASNLLEPKRIEVNGCVFIISKMPCTVAQEVICKLPAGFIPMLGNFSQSEEMAFKMLSYCERVYTDGRLSVRLMTKELIDNHVPDFDTLIKLERECFELNYDFFAQGKLLDFLNKGLCHVESKLSGILTDLLDKLLQAGVPLTGNSNTDTP